MPTLISMYVNGYRDPMGEEKPWTQELWASEQADAEDGSGELRFICTLNNPHACGIGGTYVDADATPCEPFLRVA